jgi:hypothetical protein
MQDYSTTDKLGDKMQSGSPVSLDKEQIRDWFLDFARLGTCWVVFAAWPPKSLKIGPSMLAIDPKRLSRPAHSTENGKAEHAPWKLRTPKLEICLSRLFSFSCAEAEAAARPSMITRPSAHKKKDLYMMEVVKLFGFFDLFFAFLSRPEDGNSLPNSHQRQICFALRAI